MLFNATRFQRLAKPPHLGGWLGEVGIDGIELLDRRQILGAVGVDQRALRNHGATDAAGDRRFHVGILQIKLRRIETGTGRGDIGVGLRQLRHGAVQILAARNVALAKLLLSIRLLARQILCRDRVLQGRFGAFDLNLKLGGIDLVENVAFLDETALFEHPLDDDPGHPGTNLGDPGRGNTTGEIVDDGKRFRLDRNDADRRRRRGGRIR